MLTKIGNWTLVVGIDWTMPSDASEVRAERKKKERAGMATVLMQSNAGQRWLGFHAPLTGTAYAAALLVGMVKADAIVYQPLDDENAWVCAIQDGMPAPGYDRVLPASEARNTAIEWSSMFPSAEMIGELSGAQASLGDVVAVLDEALQNKSLQKKQIAVALLHSSGTAFKKAAGMVGVVVLAGGLAYGVTWYLDVRQAQQEQQLSLEEAARRALASEHQKAELEARRQAALVSFKEQIGSAQAAQQVRFAPTAMWEAVTRVRRSVPHSNRGFKPQAFECSAQMCRVNWLGTGKFVSASDKLHLPNVERNLSADLVATSVYPMTVVQDRLPRAGVQSADELRFYIQSGLSMHMKSVVVEAAQAQSVTPPPGTGGTPAVVAEVGKWRAQIAGPSALLDTGAVLVMASKLPIRVTSIKYQPGPSSVDLEGEFVFIPEQKE